MEVYLSYLSKTSTNSWQNFWKYKLNLKVLFFFFLTKIFTKQKANNVLYVKIERNLRTKYAWD